MTDEAVIMEADKVFKWDGPKRKQTLIKAKLGRLVLTDSRFMFLSTGKNDITIGRLAGGAVSPLLGLRTGSTDGLDVAASKTAGGVNVARDQVRGAELKGMFKVLTVAWVDDDGVESVATFAPKNGGMPDGPSWVSLLAPNGS